MKAILLLLLLCTSCSTISVLQQPQRVLFIGNSLTYVGNVPAVFAALSNGNGKPVVVEMIVKGGATLSQRVSDESLTRALAKGKYTTLVLQERGGDLTCAFGPDSCVRSREAIKELAAAAKERRTKVFLLGTYQPHPLASRALIREESTAAAHAAISYIEVSETLQALRASNPQLTWLASDGSHPGKDLALLNALLVYKSIYGSLPSVGELTVRAPIYGVKSGLTEDLRHADAPPPLPATLLELTYPASTVGSLVNAVRRASGS